MHIYIQTILNALYTAKFKSLKFSEKGFWISDKFEDDIYSDFVVHYSSIKVEFELEDEVSHDAQKHKEPKKNKDVNPIDLKNVMV